MAPFAADLSQGAHEGGPEARLLHRQHDAADVALVRALPPAILDDVRPLLVARRVVLVVVHRKGCRVARPSRGGSTTCHRRCTCEAVPRRARTSPSRTATSRKPGHAPYGLCPSCRRPLAAALLAPPLAPLARALRPVHVRDLHLRPRPARCADPWSAAPACRRLCCTSRYHHARAGLKPPMWLASRPNSKWGSAWQGLADQMDEDRHKCRGRRNIGNTTTTRALLARMSGRPLHLPSIGADCSSRTAPARDANTVLDQGPSFVRTAAHNQAHCVCCPAVL